MTGPGDLFDSHLELPERFLDNALHCWFLSRLMEVVQAETGWRPKER